MEMMINEMWELGASIEDMAKELGVTSEELNAIPVTMADLPVASYMYENYWKGVDGTVYEII